MNEQDLRTLLSSILLLYMLVVSIGCIFVALWLEKRLKEREPSTLPYRWGFYVGSVGLAWLPVGMLIVVAALAAALKGQGETAVFLFVFSMPSVIYVIAGWFVIKRRPWAWFVITLFSCNLIIWIINYIYGKNRWAELGRDPHSPRQRQAERP